MPWAKTSNALGLLTISPSGHGLSIWGHAKVKPHILEGLQSQRCTISCSSWGQPLWHPGSHSYGDTQCVLCVGLAWQCHFTATQPTNTSLKSMESPLGLWEQAMPVLSFWGLPAHPMGQEAVGMGALAICAHCAISPHCGMGTRGIFCSGVAPHSWVLTPAPARDPPQPSHLCPIAPSFCSWRGWELWLSQGSGTSLESPLCRSSLQGQQG